MSSMFSLKFLTMLGFSLLWTFLVWYGKIGDSAYVGLLTPTLIAWLAAHVQDKKNGMGTK